MNNEKKLKLLYVSHAVEEEGGAEISLKTFAEEFTRHGHKIVYAALKEYSEFKTYIFKKFKPIYTYELYEIYLSNFLKKVIQKERPDIIHANDRFSIIPSIIAAKKTGIPVVANFRDFCLMITSGGIPYHKKIGFFKAYSFKEIFQTSSWKRMPWEVYKYIYIKRRYNVLNSADAKIFHSSAVQEWAEKQGIRNTQRVFNAIEPGFPKKTEKEKIRVAWNIPKKAKVISFLSAFNSGKGVDIIIELIRKIDMLKGDPYFLLLGDGEKKETILELAKNNKKVIYLGKIPHTDIYKVYKASDIVLMPSKIEPFSRIVIESMSMGVPVISSNKGGGKDVIENGKSGLLVDPEDVNDWIKGINSLLENNKLIRSFKSQFPKIVSRYSRENSYKDLLRVYNKII